MRNEIKKGFTLIELPVARKRAFTRIALPVMRKRAFTLLELPVVRKRAFTLIELLVVIAIIGILATVVILNVTGAREKAVTAKVKSDVNQIQKASELYLSMGGNFVNVYQGGTVPVGICSSWDSNAIVCKLNQTILNSVVDLDTGQAFVGSSPTHPLTGKTDSVAGTKDYYWASIAPNGFSPNRYYIAGSLSTNGKIYQCHKTDSGQGCLEDDFDGSDYSDVGGW